MQNGIVHRMQVQTAQPLNDSELCQTSQSNVKLQGMQENS